MRFFLRQLQVSCKLCGLPALVRTLDHIRDGHTVSIDQHDTLTYGPTRKVLTVSAAAHMRVSKKPSLLEYVCMPYDHYGAKCPTKPYSKTVRLSYEVWPMSRIVRPY